jgi:ABC-2 type transport system ATP-binding protein
VRVADGRAHLTVDSDAIAGTLPALGALGVQGLRIEPPSLEDLFLRHYGDDLGGGEETAQRRTRSS